jgi:hypothetical protein
MECRREGAVTISGVLLLDDELWLVVHDIRLRGALRAVVTDEQTEVRLRRLVEIGALRRDARGVRLTAAAREQHTVWARFAPGSGAEAAARRAYERFLPLNRLLLRICHDWQVRPGGVPNDHRDTRYDWGVVDRLRGLDERVQPVVGRLGRLDPRFGTYRPRLRAALARVDAGEHAWLTSPRCDSYHTVWMQLHEDLLLALGAERAHEP